MKNKEKNIKREKSKNNQENLDIIKVKEKKSSNEILKKILSKTLYTVTMVVTIIAIYLGINIWVEEINPNDIDLTKDKVYSLSDASKQIAKSVNKEVNIILVNMSNAQAVVDFSNRYSKENNLIKVTEINNVNEHPTLMAKYNLTDTTYEIIIQCSEREKILTTYDLYTYDYTTGEEIDLTEEAITNAILDVTIENKPKVYFLTGHNPNLEYYMSSFKNSVASDANQVENLDLLTTGKVPDDCSVLAITTLNEDIKVIERDAIIKYIKKGGKIILFTDANVTKIKMPNFQKILDQYGISISEGIMVEQDSNKMLSGSPSAILVTVESGTSITENINMDTNACFINTGKINFKDSKKLEKLGVTVENLATTSSKAFYRADLTIESTNKQKEDEEGSAIVGALLTKNIDDETTSKLIVYSNNMFITNMQISLNNQYYLYAYELYNNEDLALNSISYLTGREDTIMIRKNTEDSNHMLTEMQRRTILLIIVAIPALIIVTGIIVWQVRRKK